MNWNPWKVIAILCLAGAIATCTAEPAAPQLREVQAYDNGTTLLNQSKWEAAANEFGKVADAHGKRADAALYWKAYALDKQGERSEALAVVDALRKQYPRSNWIKDASALEVEIRQTSGQTVDPQLQKDDETKLLALNNVMDNDPPRALPLLKIILASNASKELKSQALFVLAQSNSEQAQQMLVAIARGSSHSELQPKAIEYLGANPSPQRTAALGEVFRTSKNPEVKRAVLNAYVICGCRGQIFEVAKQATDARTKRDAILALVAADGQGELRQMFSTAKSPEEKRDLIQAFIAIGDRQSIDRAYKNATTPDEKGEAFHGFIALEDRDAIRESYKNAKTIDDRKAAIQGFIALGDSDGLAQAAKAATDEDTNLAVVHGYVALGGGQPGTDTLLQIYNAADSIRLKKAVINALCERGQAKELIALDRKQHDPELHRSIVHQLSEMNDPAAKDYLREVVNR